jgi:hypothetical protein
MAPEVKTAKNSKLPKLSENCFELVGKVVWTPISIWIKPYTHLVSSHVKGEVSKSKGLKPKGIYLCIHAQQTYK